MFRNYSRKTAKPHRLRNNESATFDVLKSAIGLYIHIPFCRRRCGYCAFATVANEDRALWERYLNALRVEMKAWTGVAVDTVFLGGGTPTLWPADLLVRLAGCLGESFDINKEAEWTIEGHPSTLIGSEGEGKLVRLVESGFNRLSLGIESFEAGTLSRLGREYSLEDAARVISAARAAGFVNINLDLISGWPWEDMSAHRRSLDQALSLQPQHMSVYSLKIEEGTPFAKEKISLNCDLQADYYQMTHETLAAAGFRHYEVANFARLGFEARHNLKYWHYQDYLGLGAAASSKINGKSFVNARGLDAYLERMQEGLSPAVDEESLDDEEINRRRTILGLRLGEGVEQALLERYGDPEAVNNFRSRGYLVEENGRSRLTPDGWLVSNQLFIHVLAA
ncbi:MAG: radical SAM family heme chaperone HemW [Elusimicrobia bacterium]|nr:radical SAM family heme chaperone HemW [Elusimicrobiota bacterium]